MLNLYVLLNVCTLFVFRYRNTNIVNQDSKNSGVNIIQKWFNLSNIPDADSQYISRLLIIIYSKMNFF